MPAARAPALTQERLQEILENEWLNLGDTSLIQVTNPFDERDAVDIEQPLQHVLKLMRCPGYFSFTCKHLFNKTVTPQQLAILRELWLRPFPMLIGSRGMGKCAAGDTRVFTNTGLCRLQELAPDGVVDTPGLKVLGENGFKDVAYAWNNGQGPTVQMFTRCGYDLEGTPNHPIRVVSSGKVVWKNMEELQAGDYVIVSRSTEWHPDVEPLDDEVGYFLGLLAGDGGFTVRGRISFTTADQELADAVSAQSIKLWGKPFLKQSRPYAYQLSSVQAWEDLFHKYGFPSSVCEQKDVPRAVLRGPMSAAAAFLRGLFDTDGTVLKSTHQVQLAARSPHVVRTVQVLLTRFGIVSKRFSKHNNRYGRDYWYLNISGPSLRIFEQRIGFGLQSKADKLRQVASASVNPNIDLIPRELVLDDILKVLSLVPRRARGSGRRPDKLSPSRLKAYDISYALLHDVLGHTREYASETDEWKRLDHWCAKHFFFDRIEQVKPGECVTYDVHVPDDHSFISNGVVSHNSFILALYAILRATLCQGVKVAIVGAAFRQAKVVFEYCEEIWHNAPLLRDICRSNHMNGPRRDIDRCTFRIGDSMIIALPLGDGCLSGDSLVTYGDRFGTISDHVSGHIHQTPGLTVWGNGRLRPTDESYDNGFKDTRIIRTAKGFQLEGTLNHRLRVLRDGQVEWLRFDQMQPGDKVLIDRSIRWHAGQETVSEDEAYALGAMIGDGCYVNCYRLGFATTEPEHFIPALNRGTGHTFTRAPDGQHWNFFGKQEITDWRARWELKPVRTIDKVLPPVILGASRQAMSACLRGLFDTDGGVQVSKAKGGTSICVSLTNTSEQLMRQVQYILLHYGIVAHLSSRERKDEWNTVYELHITGKDVALFAEHIGFALPRKAAELQRGLRDKARSVSIGDTIPGALQLMREVASENRVRRGAGTSDSVAVSASKLATKKEATQDLARRFLKTYGHLEDERVQTVRLLCNPSVYYDEIVSIEESSCQTFDIHVPDGHEYCANGFFSHNTKIRGQRANVIVADEFACLEKNTLVQTTAGLRRIGEIVERGEEVELIRADGAIVKPDRYIRTPPTTAYRVRVANGYEFVCSGIHKVLTTQGFKLARDLTSDDWLVHQSSDYFPAQQVREHDVLVNPEVGWLLGTLVAEGAVSSKYSMQVHSTSLETVERTRRTLEGLTPNRVGLASRPAYTDARGWSCKESFVTSCCDLKLRDTLERLGLSRVRAEDKSVPDCVLRSPRDVVISFLSGLFDGDGSAFLWSSRGCDSHLGVAYYTTSERLATDVQQLLHKLGLTCYRTNRKSKLSERSQWMLRLNGEDAHRLASMLDVPRWREVVAQACPPYQRPRDGVIWDKSRSKWKAEVRKEGRVVYLGRFDTEEEARACVEKNRPVPHLRVLSVERLPEEQVLYDFHVPDGNQFLGACFVQHNSIPVEIFENVVSGFAAVSMDPIAKLKAAATQRAMRRLGLVLPEKDEGLAVPGLSSNQTVLSGTAYYGFNHFCDYWRKWKAIVESKGEKRALEDIFRGEVPEKLDWRDYSVIRVPVRMLPEGFMDERHVAKARATIHLNQYLMEYGAVFAADSNGFFKRSLVESCVVGKPDRPISHSSCGEVNFNAVLRGEPTRSYVMAIDPASEKDNFSVVVLELWPDHRRIVHCWTTTRSRHKAKLKKGLVKEQDFYSYTARRIRDLMSLFPCERIALDSQGGGVAVMEALADNARLLPGEKLILPVIDPEKPRESDNLPGEHILEIISFAKADWVAEANHGLRKDMEDKALLFPEFNPAVVGLAIEEDKILGRVKVGPDGEEKLYDTLEDCTMEIEELKDELASIVHTQVGTSGRDRWDTPEVKLAGGKKGRLRKDRYSALLMANMVARTYQRVPRRPEFLYMGGFAHELVKQKESLLRPQWQNPDWYEQHVASQHSGYGAVVKRG